MSPRAACRLESLGFGQVFDYVPGKADWMAAGLAMEGPLAEGPRAGDVMRTDPPTCRPAAPLGDRLHRRNGQRLDPDEPLQRQHGLDHGAAPRAVSDRVVVVLDTLDIAADLQLVPDRLAGLEPILAAEGAAGVGDPGPGVDHLDRLEVVTRGDLEVQRIMGWGHLDRAGAELHLHRSVGDDRDLAIEERQKDRPANSVAIALIIGVHRDRSVAEHGLGAGRSNAGVAGAVGIRIEECPQIAVAVFIFDFIIRQGSLCDGVPVD